MVDSENKFSNIEHYCCILSKWVNEQKLNVFSQHMTQFMLSFNKNICDTQKKDESNVNKEPNQTPVSNFREPPHNNQVRDVNDADSVDMPIQGQRYSLPHPLRRMTAEFLDYLLLMVIKISIIFLVQGNLSLSEIAESIDVDFRYIVNKHKLSGSSSITNENQYGGRVSGTNNEAVGGNDNFRGARAALNPFEIITMEIVYAEIINRIIITFYEAICLSGLLCNLSATPGKYIMGIRVVLCKDLFDLPLERVEVLPGCSPGFICALVRSLIKNFAMVFFLPLCMTALIFNHHRTSYDLIAGTIVVKVPPPRQHRLNMAGVAARNPVPAAAAHI